MFERYTEKARRTIFFARYEASQLGWPEIEAECLLLGLLRENAALSTRFFRTQTTPEALREAIARHRPRGKQFSTSVDIPLSNESKHVLAYAAEEAARLDHHFIGTEHLLLGILRERNSFAARLLEQCGVGADTIRKDIRESHPAAHLSHSPRIPATLGYFELVLKTADLNAAVDFYTKLGFERTGNRGPGTAVLANGACSLLLAENAVADRVLTFYSSDMAVVASRLQVANVPFEQTPATASDGNTLALLRDPDGNLIALHGPRRTVAPTEAISGD